MMTDEMFDEMMERWRKRQQNKPFSDWAKDEGVDEWAKNSSLFNGGDGGNMMPLDMLTREQLMAVVIRLLAMLGK